MSPGSGPNRPLALELFFACSRLGALFLPLNSRLTVAEHQWIINDADPTLLVADPAFDDHLAAAALGRQVATVADDDVLTGETAAPRVGTPLTPGAAGLHLRYHG